MDHFAQLTPMPQMQKLTLAGKGVRRGNNMFTRVFTVLTVCLLSVAGCDSSPRVQGGSMERMFLSMSELEKRMPAEEFKRLDKAVRYYDRLPSEFLKSRGLPENVYDFIDGKTARAIEREVARLLVEYGSEVEKEEFAHHLEREKSELEDKTRTAVETLISDLKHFANVRARYDDMKRVFAGVKDLVVQGIESDRPKNQVHITLKNQGNIPVMRAYIRYGVTSDRRQQPYQNLLCDWFFAGGLEPKETAVISCGLGWSASEYWRLLNLEGSYPYAQITSWVALSGERFDDEVEFPKLFKSVAERLKSAGLVGDEDVEPLELLER